VDGARVTRYRDRLTYKVLVRYKLKQVFRVCVCSGFEAGQQPRVVNLKLCSQIYEFMYFYIIFCIIYIGVTKKLCSQLTTQPTHGGHCLCLSCTLSWSSTSYSSQTPCWQSSPTPCPSTILCPPHDILYSIYLQQHN
jgi:hypothetical protein